MSTILSKPQGDQKIRAKHDAAAPHAAKLAPSARRTSGILEL